MDTGRLCMFCMEDNEGQSVCPHCGKDANAPLIKNHLKPGEILGGRFLVGRAVGQDASGVVYIVYDLRKERALRIREYLFDLAYESYIDTLAAQAKVEEGGDAPQPEDVF